jgi:methionyl-tRNA formyltransferase
MMKFLFVGNRKFVLEEMVKRRLSLAGILVVKNTHLEKDLSCGSMPYIVVGTKSELLTQITCTDFDVLVSNGCPYILPISALKRKVYVNVHPSLLPDLKGVDPVIGSILFERDAGATCHVMDDSVDGGGIISQVRIPYSSDLDVSLLYQLSFIAEKEAFLCALERKFAPARAQAHLENAIYYTRKPEDRTIFFNEPAEVILRKVKGFGNLSQGCFFGYAGETYKVYNAECLTNAYLQEYSTRFTELQIVLCYENSIIFKKDGKLIKFSSITGELSKIKVGSFLECRKPGDPVPDTLPRSGLSDALRASDGGSVPPRSPKGHKECEKT